MFHVHCLNKISKAGTDCFNENYEVGAEVQNPDAVMVRSASMHEMDFNPELLAIARASTIFRWTAAARRASWCSTHRAPTPTR